MPELSKKLEKFASAIYLITSFFVEREPIKWKLRTLVLDLVSLSTNIKDNFHKDQEVFTLKTKSKVSEVANLLQVARNANLISEGNSTLLNQELLSYLNLLSLPSGIKIEEGKIFLNPDHFEVDSKIGDIKPEIETISHPHLLSTTQPTYVGKESNLKKYGTVSVKKNSRQSIIVSILKRKKEVMIKDISPLISNCSEKTIQRELSAMVRTGVIKKTGDKRWSKYSLA